jgi:hypothetical protein
MSIRRDRLESTGSRRPWKSTSQQLYRGRPLIGWRVLHGLLILLVVSGNLFIYLADPYIQVLSLALDTSYPGSCHKHWSGGTSVCLAIDTPLVITYGTFTKSNRWSGQRSQQQTLPRPKAWTYPRPVRPSHASLVNISFPKSWYLGELNVPCYTPDYQAGQTCQDLITKTPTRRPPASALADTGNLILHLCLSGAEGGGGSSYFAPWLVRLASLPRNSDQMRRGTLRMSPSPSPRTTTSGAVPAPVRNRWEEMEAGILVGQTSD